MSEVNAVPAAKTGEDVPIVRPHRPASSITRTTAILEAIRQQLERRRALLDIADDLGTIQVTVRMQAGSSTVVRAVTVSEERIVRRA